MSSDPAVAVVGGGVVGTSILYHLTKNGVDAVLFEKNQLASGATSKAAGGVRNVFSHPMNVEVGTRNLEFYRQFTEKVGADLEYDETGYVYCYHDEDERREWADRSTRLREQDVATRLLDPDSVTELFSLLDGSQVAGGFYAPLCLHLDPYTVTQGFATAAQRGGATVRTKTPVESIEVANGHVDGITTAEGTLDPDYVVNAAGPWGVKLAESVGIDLPIDLSARRIAVTEQLMDEPSPLMIDRQRRCYFRTERNGSLLLCDIDGDIDHVDDPAEIQSGSIGYDYYLDALSKVSELVPAIEDAEVINGWAGVQTHTPDGHPILGETSIGGFLLANGFNGLGVMMAPTVGAAIADLVAHGSTDAIDVDRLGLDRFEVPERERIAPEELA